MHLGVQVADCENALPIFLVSECGQRDSHVLSGVALKHDLERVCLEVSVHRASAIQHTEPISHRHTGRIGAGQIGQKGSVVIVKLCWQAKALKVGAKDQRVSGHIVKVAAC